MLTYTILGLQLFANRIKFNENDELDLEHGISPRVNFDNFSSAFTAVFVVLQGETYHKLMYNVARACGHEAVIYFVVLLITGQIILLKLFLAVLLDNFEDKRKELE